MNKENTNTATDILNNPLAGYKNVTHNQKWCWGIGKQVLTNNF